MLVRMDPSDPSYRRPAGRPVPLLPDPRRSRYVRERDLPGLLPLWPHDIGDHSPAGRARVLGLLRSALRAERRRGLAGHWSYDLARHVGLLRAYRHELAAAQACAHRECRLAPGVTKRP